MEGQSRPDALNGVFYLDDTSVGNDLGTNQEAIPLTALDNTGRSFTTLLFLPDPVPGHGNEISPLSAAATHGRAAEGNDGFDLPNSEAIHQATENDTRASPALQTGVVHTQQLSGTDQSSPVAESSGESQNPMVDNGQTSSRKRTSLDNEEGSQLDKNLEPHIILNGVGNRRGASGRKVSRRTVHYGQASSSSSSVNPIAVPLSHYGVHGNGQVSHAVGHVAASVQLTANDGRAVGNMQIRTVDHSQASINHPIPINGPAVGHRGLNSSGEGLHAMGQITAAGGGTANSSGDALEEVHLTGTRMATIVYHMEVFLTLSPAEQALVLTAPPSGGVLSSFARHVRAFSSLPPHGRVLALAEVNRRIYEMHAGLIPIQMHPRPAFENIENDRVWYTAVQRELELDLMRIDVDHMSYEQILALEERIGNVNTGLNEQAILLHVNQHKHPVSRWDPRITTEPCTICLDDFRKGQNVGTLECGHKFHFQCIKTWLMQKNSCPICKVPAVRTP
ncbi:hypothetical protein Dimus_014306 [Dionaea muscipula]